MRFIAIGVMGFALATALACGGDSTGPATSRNNAGTGTSSLRVVADIDGEDVPGGFITDFSVSVRNGAGLPVSGATVTVRNSALGTVTLDEVAAGTGEYFAGRLVFPAGDFHLDVVKGTDNVRGVIVGGPGIHSIMSPVRNSTLTANQTVLVQWSRPSQAKAAEVETNDFGPVAIPDNGVYSIPAASNPQNNSQRIRVYRYNEVDMAGALPGSRLRVEVRNTVEPVVVQ